MKFTCSQKYLKEALLAVSKALPAGKPQTPILSGIYIKAAGNLVELHANDFSTGMLATIPAEVEGEGEIVVKGKDITEVVGKFSGAAVVMFTNDEEKTAILQSNATTFSLYTMDAEDFPRVTENEYVHSFFIKSTVLKNLIMRSIFAAANDDKNSRPVFQGCSITIAGNNISFVATNTHRLVVVKDNIEDEIEGENNVIVPAATLNDILGILNSLEEDQNVKIDFSDKHIALTIDNIFITCRLIDGAFPPYEKVIPASCETFATVKISEFASAINRVEIISRQSEYNTVKLKFDGEGLELAANSYETGRVVEHLNAEVEGPNVEIAFNLRYIKEFLRIAGGCEEVRIGMNDSLSPADFRLPDEENLIYIITPVRTQ